MSIRNEFLKLAGLNSTRLKEAEQQDTEKFAKGSTEVMVVKTAVRKAIHQLEKQAGEVRSVNLRKTYEDDANAYDTILGCINAHNQSAARRYWLNMDTAARDVVFDLTTDKEARRTIAEYLGAKLLKESDETVAATPNTRVFYLVMNAAPNSEFGDVFTEINNFRTLRNIILGSDPKDSEVYELFSGDERQLAEQEANRRIEQAKSLGEGDSNVEANLVGMESNETDDKTEYTAKETTSESTEVADDSKTVEQDVERLTTEGASEEVKVVDAEDAVKGVKPEEKSDKTKVPSNVMKDLKDKIKELENEIKYTSHLRSQEQQIVNLNNTVEVMRGVQELLDDGSEDAIKRAATMLTSLESTLRFAVPDSVWKFVAVDFSNPLSKSNLVDRFKEVKVQSSKLK